MCRYCGYKVAPGYPGEAHTQCLEKRIADLEAVLREIGDLIPKATPNYSAQVYKIARRALGEAA